MKLKAKTFLPSLLMGLLTPVASGAHDTIAETELEKFSEIKLEAFFHQIQSFSTYYIYEAQLEACHEDSLVESLQKEIGENIFAHSDYLSQLYDQEFPERESDDDQEFIMLFMSSMDMVRSYQQGLLNGAQVLLGYSETVSEGGDFCGLAAGLYDENLKIIRQEIEDFSVIPAKRYTE